MDPRGLEALQMMSGGYAPLATGIPPYRRTGFEGLFPNSPLGLTAGMFLQPYAQQAMAAVGMTPFGTGHDQNLYDFMRQQSFSQAQMAAMQKAKQADVQNYMSTARGFSELAGGGWGPNQQAQFQPMADFVGAVTPFMAMARPDWVRAFSGPRGNATMMTQEMMASGRYRIDPVTGRMGISADSAASYAVQAMQGMMRQPGQLNGLTIDQAGSLFSELQARGLNASGLAPLSGNPQRQRDFFRGMDRSELSAAGGNQGVEVGRGVDKLTPADLDKLSMDPAVADRLRSMDWTKLDRTIKAYSGAIAAMRDIFGDLGKPNASMPELMAGIDAMTGGGLGQLGPARLGNIARHSYGLAVSSGVGMPGLAILQGHAASRAQQMGLHPVFGAEGAQAGMAAIEAFRAMNLGEVPSWGAMSVDQMGQFNANRRVSAAASPAANQLGALMRIQQATGGFKSGTTAAALAAAVAAGHGTFIDPATGTSRSVLMAQDDFIGTMQKASGVGGASLGLNQNTLLSLLNQDQANQEQISRFGIAKLVQNQQPEEVAGIHKDAIALRLVVDSKFDRRAVGSAVDAIYKRMMAMGSEFADPATRNAGVAAILKDELGRRGVDTGDDAALRLAADMLHGDVNQAIAGSPYGSWTLENTRRAIAMTPGTEQAELNTLRANEIKAAMAVLPSRGHLLSNIIGATQDVIPRDPEALKKWLAQGFLGGISTAAVSDKFVSAVAKHAEARQTAEQLQRQLDNETDPERRADLEKQKELALQELAARSAALEAVSRGTDMWKDPNPASTREYETIARLPERARKAAMAHFHSKLADTAENLDEWNRIQITFPDQPLPDAKGTAGPDGGVMRLEGVLKLDMENGIGTVTGTGYMPSSGHVTPTD